MFNFIEYHTHIIAALIEKELSPATIPRKFHSAKSSLLERGKLTDVRQQSLLRRKHYCVKPRRETFLSCVGGYLVLYIPSTFCEEGELQERYDFNSGDKSRNMNCSWV